MNRSESISNIAAALVKAQADLRNPHFDSTNPHFRSKFASLAAVREAVVPVFAKHGLAVTQWPVTRQNYAGCITHIAHVSGEWMDEEFTLPVEKGNAHGYASVVTYAKRISLQSVACVVGEEDDDANASVEPPKKVAAISGAAVKEEQYNNLNDDERLWLSDLADVVAEMVKNGSVKDAYDEIQHAIPFDPPRRPAKYVEYKVGLDHLLDSKTRSALAKHKDSLKAAA